MTWTEDDPGQGDPDGLLALARDLQGDADDAASAARTLRSVQQNAGDAVWQGSSADAFRDRIDKLPGHLDKLNASYSDAAAGLRAYAASVRQIADDARVQQQIASQSTTDLHSAQTQQAAWTPPPHPATGQPDPTAKNPHDEQIAAANASIRKAQAQLHQIAGHRKAVDGQLVDALKQAHGQGMRNKHWWQKALDFVSDALAKITIVLMVVALVAIVVLAIVQPELIPGLLLLAGEAMSALSAAQLAVDGGRKLSGEDVSWGSLALDAVGALSGAGVVGALGRFAESAPLLGRTVGAVRDLSGAVRSYGAAGSAFARSLGSDLKAVRVVVRVAHTSEGFGVPVITRESKTGTQMMSEARQAATKAFGSGRGPHTAVVSVERGGEKISSETITSGNMTPDEAALGFPRSSLATHTEARAVRAVELQPGDTMRIEGQYPPCPSCRGAMNQAVAGAPGAKVIYTWPGGEWVAGG